MKPIFSLFILAILSSYVSTQGPWTQVTGGATQIAVDPSGNPWIVDNQNYIYRRTSTGFVKLTGLANDIGIGANGDVWVIGTDSQSGGYGIHKYVPAQNTWTQVNGGAMRIAVDPQGNPWIVNSLGYIYKRTSSGFLRMPGLATDIGIGTNGDVWVIGKDSQVGGFGVYQYISSSNSWTQAIGGAGLRISVDPSGNPWIVDDRGYIYRRTPSGFAQLSGLGRDIAVGVGVNRNVWLVGTDGQPGGAGVYYYSPEKNPWAKISGVGAQIAVTPSGLPWVINDLGYIYRRTSNGFFNIPGMASDIAIGANGDAWMLGNVKVAGGYTISKYSSSANAWTQVNGAAVRIAVDPQGNPWVVNDQGYIYRRTSSGFVQVPGLAKEIAVGASGVVYVIGTDVQSGGYGIHRYSSSGNTWTQVSGGAVRVAVDLQGNPWIINDQGLISRWTGTGFMQLPGLATEIAIGASGNVWILGTTKLSGGYDIYQYVS